MTENTPTFYELCPKCNSANLSLYGQGKSQKCNECKSILRVREVCSKCSRLKPVHYRDGDKPVCNAHPKPKHLCSRCGKLRQIAYEDNGEKICRECNRESLYKRKCSNCGQESIRCFKNPETDLPVCRQCYHKAKPLRKRRRKKLKAKCSVCGEEKLIHIKKTLICRDCYKETMWPKEKCSNCKEELPVYSRKDGVILCKKCYGVIHRKTYKPKKRKCSECGKIKQVAFRNGKKPICSACRQNQLRKLRKIDPDKCNISSHANKMPDGRKIRCKTCNFMRMVAKIPEKKTKNTTRK